MEENKEKITNWYNIGDEVFVYLKDYNKVEKITISGMYFDIDENCIYYNSLNYRNLIQGIELSTNVNDLKKQIKQMIDMSFDEEVK